MATRKLAKGSWRTYFDRFTKKFCKDTMPEFSRIEVLSAEMGVQLESAKAQLLGLTYDHKEDALEAEFGEFVHRVFHPKEIHVDEDEEGFIQSLKVVVEKIDLKTRKGREEVLTLTHSPGVKGLMGSGSGT